MKKQSKAYKGKHIPMIRENHSSLGSLLISGYSRISKTEQDPAARFSPEDKGSVGCLPDVNSGCVVNTLRWTQGLGYRQHQWGRRASDTHRPAKVYYTHTSYYATNSHFSKFKIVFILGFHFGWSDHKCTVLNTSITVVQNVWDTITQHSQVVKNVTTLHL